MKMKLNFNFTIGKRGRLLGDAGHMCVCGDYGGNYRST